MLALVRRCARVVDLGGLDKKGSVGDWIQDRNNIYPWEVWESEVEVGFCIGALRRCVVAWWVCLFETY